VTPAKAEGNPLLVGVGEDAGRGCVPGGISCGGGRHPCTHHATKPQLADLVLLVSQAYNLKAVADYELGPGASVPLDRAAQSVEQIASMLA
jgi:hypothetical protein